MPSFDYQAVGSDGAPVKGVVFGSSIDQAIRDLSAKGLQITQIGLAARTNDPLAAMPVAAAVGPVGAVPVSARSAVERPAETVDATPDDNPYATSTSMALGESAPPVIQRSYIARAIIGPLVGKVPLQHQLFFFRQGATMLNAGVPIVQAFTTLSNQARNHKFKGIIQEITRHVHAGRPISAGLQRYPEVFSPVVVSLVRAGEEGGFLDEAMKTSADYLEREIELRNLYKRATFMPKLTVATSIFIVLATNFALKMLNAERFNLASPLTEPSTWVWLAPTLIGLFLFFTIGLANPAIRYVWDSFVSHVPYLGGTLRQLAMARFGRTFGALYRGGVPMVKALHLSADSIGNEFLRARMYPAYKGLESGAGITETFRATKAFNPIVIDMVSTGEQTGNLDDMLNKVAAYYEDEAATRSQKLGQVVGVCLIILVALYVLYILVNFYMGYYGGIMNEGAKE